MSEYCDYCQVSVEPWDEGDGKYSCPSCLNILIDDNKTLTAAQQDIIPIPQMLVKIYGGETNPQLGTPDILRGGKRQHLGVEAGPDMIRNHR